MRKRYLIAALSGLVFAPSVTARAQVVDQSNSGTPIGSFYSHQWQGQTFRPSMNTSVGGGFVLFTQSLFFGNPLTGTMSLELWSDVASNPGATLLASGNSPFSLGPNSQTMIDVFWPAVSLTPGSQYFLTMYAVGSDLIYTAATAPSYASGGAFFGGGTSTAPYSDLSRNYDLLFNTYAATPQVVATPEPASMMLVATGLLGVLAVKRRRTARM